MEIIGEGATTKVYREGDRAIKIYIGTAISEIEEEAALQAKVHSTGLPVPNVYGVRKISETEIALDMEYIRGKPLMNMQMTAEELNMALQTLVSLQIQIHKTSVDNFPKQSEKLKYRLENCPLDSDVKAILLNLLSHLKNEEKSLCHGDFHPLNILRDERKLWIIDWVDATIGNPKADACRSYVLFRQHISTLAEDYLREFCKASGYEKDDVLAWLPVIAAARLCEGPDEDGVRLLRGMVELGLVRGC